MTVSTMERNFAAFKAEAGDHIAKELGELVTGSIGPMVQMVYLLGLCDGAGSLVTAMKEFQAQNGGMTSADAQKIYNDLKASTMARMAGIGVAGKGKPQA